MIEMATRSQNFVNAVARFPPLHVRVPLVAGGPDGHGGSAPGEEEHHRDGV